MKKPLLIFFCLLSILLFNSPLHGKTEDIRILYLNDLHGFTESYKPYGSKEHNGGAASLSWLIEKLRKEKPSLLFAAGDMIQGNNWANLFKGKSVIELMNYMEFDAMVLGNHEFDFGQKILKQRIEEAIFPLICANIEINNESAEWAETLLIKPYIIRELKGLKIGIIGITTEEMPTITHPKNVIGLKFLPQISTADKYVKELRNKVDFIIALTHIGYYQDLALAEKVKGIDIIVGGHSHTKLEKPTLVGNTVIVQAWAYAKALGVLDITIADGRITGINGKLIELKQSLLDKDMAVESIIEKYRKEIEGILQEYIGETEFDLDGKNTRKAETNFGNLIADIIKHRAGTEIAIINGGSIRTSINKGRIKLNDIYNALPFDNYIIAFSLTGKQIRETLESAISGIKEGKGKFPQISGITFSYSNSGDNPPEVKNILIAGKHLDPDTVYTVATNDFLAAGGDGYDIFKKTINGASNYSESGEIITGKNIFYNDPGTWIRDVVIDYIKSYKKISPTTEGRIINVP